jgi:long-chain acyl-CoA synthetase
VLSDLNRLAVENKFSGLEKLKQIHLTLDPFTIENDTLTPTMKIKRNIAKKFFEKEIAEMYAKPILS